MTIVQSASIGPVTTQNPVLTFSQPSTLQNLLVAVVWFASPTTLVSSITDSAGNIYTLQTSADVAAPPKNVFIYTAPLSALPTGNLAITLHLSASNTNVTFWVGEYPISTLAGVVLDPFGLLSVANQANINSSQYQLLNSNCLVIAAVYGSLPNTITPTSNFTSRNATAQAQSVADSWIIPAGPGIIAPFNAVANTTALVMIGLLTSTSTPMGALPPAAVVPVQRRYAYGIFQQDNGNDSDPSTYKCWTNPNLSGLSYRGSWFTAEPSPGVYNWALFDQVVALAQQYGKYFALTLVVNGGAKTGAGKQPAWLGAKGCSTYTSWEANNTKPTVVYAPWDPVFLQYLQPLIQAFGARYDGCPNLAYVAIGTGTAGGEAYLTRGSNGLPQLAAIGGVQTWIDSTLQTVGFYAQAFAQTQFIFITGVPVPGDTTSVPSILATCTHRYGAQFGFKSNGLSPSGPVADFFGQYENDHPVGFQALVNTWNNTQTAQAMMNGYLLKGQVLVDGGQLFEIYGKQTDDPGNGPLWQMYAQLIFNSWSVPVYPPRRGNLPVNLSVAAAPLGWKGQLPDLFTLLQESLVAELSPNFLIGQIGGSQPTHDVGPWLNENTNTPGWYFFDPLSGQYQPSDQGCPVGTIAMWGGQWATGFYAPQNWLPCFGEAVSRRTFSRLFAAVGETWGPGDGQTTFNLPPGAVFFINAANFIADFRVPLSPIPQVAGTPVTENTPQTSPPQGVGAKGGGQTSGLLQPTDLPGMAVYIPFISQSFVTPGGDVTGNPTAFPNAQPPGSSNFTLNQDVFLTDTNGKLLGKNQAGFSVMPPFVSIYYMIKFR